MHGPTTTLDTCWRAHKMVTTWHLMGSCAGVVQATWPWPEGNGEQRRGAHVHDGARAGLLAAVQALQREALVPLHDVKQLLAPRLRLLPCARHARVVCGACSAGGVRGQGVA